MIRFLLGWRVRTGRYGTGRLSFLTSFQNMKIRTKRDAFHKSLLLEASLDRFLLAIPPLMKLMNPPWRNGTELFLKGAKLIVDPTKLSKEIRKLAILRQSPYFKFSSSHLIPIQNGISWGLRL